MDLMFTMLEIERQYFDKHGNEISTKGLPLNHSASGPCANCHGDMSKLKKMLFSTPLGSEVTVKLHLVAHGNKSVSDIAIVDLLPGGFQVVLDESKQSSGAKAEYVEKREDRVIIYTSAKSHKETYTYKIQATNKGTYTVPPPFAESMYDLSIKARGMASKMVISDYRY